jgi:hypothetical protein
VQDAGSTFAWGTASFGVVSGTGGTLAAGVYNYFLVLFSKVGAPSGRSQELNFTCATSTCSFTVQSPSLYISGGVPAGTNAYRSYLTAPGGASGTETLQSLSGCTAAVGNAVASCSTGSTDVISSYSAGAAPPANTSFVGPFARVQLTGAGGGSSQVQSDWTEATGSAADFILHKPSIPAAPPYSESDTTGLVADLAAKAATPPGTCTNTTTQKLVANGSGGFTCATDQTGASSTILDTITMDSSNLDIVLLRSAAATIALRNGTTAQNMEIFGTYTDASNYEKFAFQTNPTSGRVYAGYFKAGTGTARDIWWRNDTGNQLWTSGTSYAWMNGSFVHRLDLDVANGDLLLTGASAGHGNMTASFFTQSSGPVWKSGTGSPEGVLTAPIGSMWSRTDGGAGTSFYVKESGSGNTGWVAK